jgi:DNA modification methylase
MKNNILLKENKVLVGEFWTAKQRQAHKIHYTISYRAAFKPELPSFFIQEFLKKKKSVVLDPFGGRGTTVIQANLEGHIGIHNDINPLSIFLAESRKIIPNLEKIEKILSKIDLKSNHPEDPRQEELLNFYHKDTLKEILNLQKIFESDKSPEMKYIYLTALSRLHGHSTGFFSVYTFPQLSISPQAQKKNNERRGEFPEYREIKSRILKKMKVDLSDPLPPFYHEFSKHNKYLQGKSSDMKSVETSTVDLIVTSPPFLDKVDYLTDNWLKSWFLKIGKDKQGGVTILHTKEQWKKFIQETLVACERVMKKNAYLVMEVGDVSSGSKIINLDDLVVEASTSTSFVWEKTYINSQKFTKLSNCWNVSNNEKGTNSNRCVIFKNRKH